MHHLFQVQPAERVPEDFGAFDLDHQTDEEGLEGLTYRRGIQERLRKNSDPGDSDL